MTTTTLTVEVECDTPRHARATLILIEEAIGRADASLSDAQFDPEPPRWRGDTEWLNAAGE
jgi:N-acetyl-beta-hexosaminidase